MRRATATDLPLLVDLMAEFYAEGAFVLNRSLATQAFAALLSDDRLGYVWLIEASNSSVVVGHAVVTLCYSMEYGGLKAFLDDLFIKPAYRNQGLGSDALSQIRMYCQQAGIRAISVEVGPDNDPAQAVYRRAGFEPVVDRLILTLDLAAPTHQS